MAVYNALAAHLENESEHVSVLQEELEAGRGDAEEVARAARDLKSIETVEYGCEDAIAALVGT